jgi:hypothetical protein
VSARTILDLCGGTGAWSQPYRQAGYRVIVVTLPDWEIRRYAGCVLAGSALDHVYGILAAPPCDHFSVSGAQYWAAKDADGRTADALAVVDACLDIVDYYTPRGLRFWAFENPIGRLRRLRAERLGDPALIFDPCDYGDPYTKRTILWGRFNKPAENPVEPVRVSKQGSWVMRLGGKSEKTKRLRSITPPGFARCFFEANQ